MANPFDLESILEMWKEDGKIDEMSYDEASRDSAKLHAKYMELYTLAKLKLKKTENEFNILLKNKWLHYNGKLSKSEIDDLGWSYDPLNGLSILKGDMDKMYDADTDIQKMDTKIHYMKTVVDTLKEIMESIKWRHQSIRNAIDWVRFTSGA
jgi:hypothetical protein